MSANINKIFLQTPKKSYKSKLRNYKSKTQSPNTSDDDVNSSIASTQNSSLEFKIKSPIRLGAQRTPEQVNRNHTCNSKTSRQLNNFVNNFSENLKRNTHTEQQQRQQPQQQSNNNNLSTTKNNNININNFSSPSTDDIFNDSNETCNLLDDCLIDQNLDTPIKCNKSLIDKEDDTKITLLFDSPLRIKKDKNVKRKCSMLTPLREVPACKLSKQVKNRKPIAKGRRKNGIIGIPKDNSINPIEISTNRKRSFGTPLGPCGKSYTTTTPLKLDFKKLKI
jgi:hypothetical protein